MSVINATPLLAAAGGDYQISRSVRLRSSASAYLSRTFSNAATNNLKGSLSIWTKRGTLGAQGDLISCYNGSSSASTDLYFNSSNQLQFDFGNTAANSLITTAVYRDPSAWYHIVVEVDTTQATSSNRVKLYVNGVQVTSFATANYPAQNVVLQIVSINANNRIGTNWNNSGAFFDGYLTEVNFIDGQALTPSSFGETDAITGVWKPKKYAGTYGTNGFYLNFSDNSSNTATTIGKDNSGNGNNWTPNNISVTSGVTYDSMIDVPTLYADGGNGRGNYAVLNPLAGGLTPTNANLTCNQGSASWASTASTFTLNTGKWYFEIGQAALTGSNYSALGLRPVGQVGSGEYTGSVSGSYGAVASSISINTYSGGVAGTTLSGTYTANSVFQCAVDFDAGKIWFGDGSSWVGGGNPANGTTPTYTFTAGAALVPYVSAYANQTNANFGQRPFAYTPPTGFKALNTQNLPAPTILKGNKYFDATTYTGNGSTQSIVNAGGFQPDLVWMKARSIAESHELQDSVRGATNLLKSNSTAAEVTAGNTLTSFNSNGFSLSSSTEINTNGATYVGWQWKANGSAVTNTSGSITSQVSAGTSQGFSVVTYTGTGSAATVGHGLGVAPKFVIIKKRSASDNWLIYSESIGATKTMFLDLTNAAATSAVFNNTAPTSAVFSLSNFANVNASGSTYVAYCFSEVAGFSRFGSYTGNGSADGPMIFTGFRPRFVMIKRTDSTGSWEMMDTSRDTYNLTGKQLFSDLSNAEFAGGVLDLISNGFKLRDGSTAHNASGGTYIFMAFAESPFRTSLAR